MNRFTRRYHLLASQLVLTTALFSLSTALQADEKPVAAGPADAGPADAVPAAAEPAAALSYPLSVAVAGEVLYVVDLDLPGIWQVKDAKRELYLLGSKFLRKALNRPRCVVVHPEGGILVGDSATREVYYLASQNAEPKPLCDGHLGIAMALAISPDKQTIYVGDAEKRAVFKLPLTGGTPELVARVNARGLSFDNQGMLWAVTPDDAAIHRINVADNSSETIVTGRPYQYPNGLVWAGDHGFVTDGYGKSIWKFTADGKTEKWFEGEPLVGPVGIAIDDQSLFIADPKKLQVFQFSRETKAITNRL